MRPKHLKRPACMAIAILMAHSQLSLAKGDKAGKKSPVSVIKPVELKPRNQELIISPSTSLGLQEDNTLGKTQSKTWDAFQKLRKDYRNGEIGDDGMWAAISTIAEDIKSLTRPQQAAILQTQAVLMQRNNQPILAAVYAAQALRDASNPLDDDYRKSWQILREVSREHPIQNLIEIVATSIDIPKRSAPGFGTDWNYFLGNALLKNQKVEKSLELYRRVKPGDRYYFPAKFQEAMILLDAKNKLEAIAALKSIVYPAGGPGSKIAKKEYTAMVDHANMALGRIYYEDQKFSDAIKHYRAVRRDSPQFYDSLFEQSWALFLAGYPNHALGMLYGVRSPFFGGAFNPEATMLASIIYYWMCRYDDAREELASFIKDHQNGIDALDKYLARGISDPNTYYRLFEDTVTGVSSEALGLPREILTMAIQQDNLLYVRDQYAAVIKEIQNIEKKGVFGNRERLEAPRSYLDQWAAVLRQEIGLRLYRELNAMKLDFERLHDQSKFLYVELLMSKKDQLLGKELHGDGKIDKVSQNDNIRGWGRKTVSWASDTKEEYWADELGFHIYRIKPLCVASH
jgi:tetratricopeptide (TPR) repeat protein